MSGNHAAVLAGDQPAAGGLPPDGDADIPPGSPPWAAVPGGVATRAAPGPGAKEFGNHSCAKGIPETTPVLSVAGVAPVGYALR